MAAVRTHVLDMRKSGWLLGLLLMSGACSDSGEGATGIGGGAHTGTGGAPLEATDTDPSNPNVTMMPPASPNGPRVTVPPGGPGSAGTTGAGGAAGTGTAGDNGGAGRPARRV